MAETKSYKTPERQRVYSVKYHAANKEARNEAARKLWNEMPERRENDRRKKLKARFGITLEQYDEMFNAQDGACKICKNPETIENRRLAVDHDHSTGKIRGLLCFKCNTIVGHIENSGLEIVESIFEYLKEEK